MGNVTIIPATIEKHTKLPTDTKVKRKVAGYARVSTDSEEQLTSYDAQVDYYTKFIQSNPDWEFVAVYTDEGISATNTKKREGFNRMITDALDGKIDLIVTKSVSRFARNTVDSLTAVRTLKDHGCEVYFEKESIYTFDSKGELLITIMSSLAQEESRSISDNVTWGQRKRFADGKVNMPFSSFLGYKRGEDGSPVIVPEEAKTVREIYKLFINGKTPRYIANYLTEKGIPSPKGKSSWSRTTVVSILTNEKYKGDAILQKKFTIDFLNKKLKLNEGEVPKYYVTDSHPAIIEREEWELVQAEFQKRKSSGKLHSSAGLFSSKIFCGDCGERYGSKVWHSTDKYRRTVWQCDGKYKGDRKCQTPHLYEEDIKRMFMSAVSKLLKDRSILLEDCTLMRDALADTAEFDKELSQLDDEMESVSALIKKLINENSSAALSQEEYTEKYSSYTERFEKAKERSDYLAGIITARRTEAEIIDGFMKEISSASELPIEFEEHLWHAMTEKVTVYSDRRIVFTFKNGEEITERLL